MPLCLTCPDELPGAHDGVCTADPLFRMQQWQLVTARYWGKNKALFMASKSSMFWVALALCLAYIPETRVYAVYPALAAVLLMTLREFIPLAPIPFGTHNTVTSTWGRYATAALVTVAALLLLALVGALVAFSEHLGNAAMGKKYTTYWDNETQWVSAALVLVPFVYLSSLAVSDRFVDQFALCARI